MYLSIVSCKGVNGKRAKSESSWSLVAPAMAMPSAEPRSEAVLGTLFDKTSTTSEQSREMSALKCPMVDTALATAGAKWIGGSVTALASVDLPPLPSQNNTVLREKCKTHRHMHGTDKYVPSPHANSTEVEHKTFKNL